MPDIATIGTFLTSIKTATELAKAIKSVDVSLERAETKLKIADLIESLADARMQAAEIQELIQDKDKRIAELEKVLELKAKLIRIEEAYYEINESGKPVGAPYCSHCWEVNHVGVHLYRDDNTNWHCPMCSNVFSRYYISVLNGNEEGST
jgi:rubrerythrin